MENTVNNTNYIKTDFIPIIREKSALARRERLAREYSEAVAERENRYKAKHKKHTRENVVCVAIAICLLVVVVALFVKAFTTPSGYYRATDTMQPDGSYYQWVEPYKCEVADIINNLIVVEYKGNEYGFLVNDPEYYEVGEKVWGIFTEDMEIVDIEK